MVSGTSNAGTQLAQIALHIRLIPSCHGRRGGPSFRPPGSRGVADYIAHASITSRQGS